MIRFAMAALLILSLAAADSRAGYYIVRVVLEGGGETAPNPEGGTPTIPGPMAPQPMGRGGPGGGEGPQPGGTGRGGTPGLQPPIGPGTDTPQAAPPDPNRSIVVVIPFTEPYSNQPFYPKGTNQRWDFQLKHAFGRTNLFNNESTYTVITKFQDLPPLRMDEQYLKKGSKTYTSEVLSDYAKWTRLKSPDPQGLFTLIVQALEHGMVPQAVDWSRELFELCERTKPQLTARLSMFLASYRAIKDDLERLPPLKNDADEWKDTIDVVFTGTKLQHGKHYSIICWDASPAELTARFSRLEDNFRAFYLWHATQGITLKLPTKPQIVVMLKGADEFLPLRLAFAGRDPKYNQIRSIDDDFYAARHDFAGLPPLTDAFLAPHHNILVVSPERVDGIGRSFRMSNRNLYREGMTRQVLLAGDGPPLSEPMANPMNPLGPGGAPSGRGGEGGQPLGPMQPMPGTGPVTRSKEDVALAQTTALVERIDEDATELAALSCEGSRQLLYASEFFPDHVDLPIWLTTGAGEFYMRPRNPVYTPTQDNKAIMAIGLTTGYGRANFAMHYRFAAMTHDRAEVKLQAVPLLKNILTDAYFTAAARGVDLDQPTNTAKTGVEEARRIDALKIKARVMAWALYYDLIKNHPTDLITFLGELKRLPRDVAIDRTTHYILFARAFRLLDNQGNIDEAAFTAFANNWFNRIRQVSKTWEEVEVTTPASAAGGAGGGTGPAIPGPGPANPRGGPGS